MYLSKLYGLAIKAAFTYFVRKTLKESFRYSEGTDITIHKDLKKK